MLSRLLMAAIAAVSILAAAPATEAAASPRLVSAVRADIGKNPTGWKRLWCAQYLRLELKALGYKAAFRKTNATARSFLRLKRTRAAIGAIAVLTRGKGGGHVGVVTGFPRKGWVRIVGGNQGKKYKNGRRVSENDYPINRVIAFVTP